MTDHDDFAFEPIPGIPAPLPAGERLLWQGSPDWKALARRPFRCRWVAAYLSLWVVLDVGLNLYQGQSLISNLDGVLTTALLGTVAVAILALLAWATARVTIYSITSERVLIRFGIALQVTLNLPFKQIVSADLACDRHGVGDLPLTLADTRRVGYFVLWPHVQAWHLRQPRPMLRALPDANAVAAVLGEALQRWHESDETRFDATRPDGTERDETRSDATLLEPSRTDGPAPESVQGGHPQGGHPKDKPPGRLAPVAS